MLTISFACESRSLTTALAAALPVVLFTAAAIAQGDGCGTFGEAVTYSSTGEYPRAVAIGDLDGDGDADIAEVNFAGDNGVAILLGNGDGTFQPAVNYDSAGMAWSVAIGDLDTDGDADLVVGHYWDSSDTPVYLGNGDGTFQSPTTYFTGGSACVIIGDFNEDTPPMSPPPAWAASPSSSATATARSSFPPCTPACLAVTPSRWAT